jgi:hypothetical protein
MARFATVAARGEKWGLKRKSVGGLFVQQIDDKISGLIIDVDPCE